MHQYQELLSSRFPTQVRHVQSAKGPSVEENTSDDQIVSYLETYFGCEDWAEFDVNLLVTKDGEPRGWSDLLLIAGSFGSGEPFDPDHYEINPIELSQVISSDTPLFEAAASLLKRNTRRLWVLEGNQITGRFSYFDLFKLPGVLCLFGLTIELEMAALDLCRCFLKQCWGALPEGRQAKAIELWHKRTDRDASRRDERLDRSGSSAYYEGLMECTTFIDKATMIHKRKLLIDTGGNKLNSIFNRAEDVRNACAHPAENDRLQSLLDDYVAFVMDCRKLIDSIRMVILKN
jgi:hypothetical protein